jgi:hypothetical protein
VLPALDLGLAGSPKAARLIPCASQPRRDTDLADLTSVDK